MTDEQIERLWKWAGLTYKEYPARFGGPPQPRTGWYKGDKFVSEHLPDLTWEAIERWFVPVLFQKGYTISPTIRPTYKLVDIWLQANSYYWLTGEGNNLVAAFLAALSKLVEAEEKNAKG